jgi:endonuclease/exonuclease/phosphatase family metal-dependent hydrolase
VSRYRRRLLSARVTGVRGQATDGIRGLRVSTAHLDSPGGINDDAAKRARRVQLEYVVKRYQDEEDVTSPAASARTEIFCGDTNLSAEGEDGLPAELGFKDAWIEAGMDGRVVTSDSLYPSTWPANRLDRILYLGEGIRSVGAELIGDEAVWCEEAGKEVHLSDHKGVMAILEVEV